MSFVGEQIKGISASLPEKVTLVAVSKFHPANAVLEAYEAGQRVFGESRVQELCAKKELLPNDIDWHFIGTLQSNKVKYIAPFVGLIHSVDNLKLLIEIDRQAEKCGRILDILLEFHIATESTKHGLSMDECTALLESEEVKNAANIRIRGVMGMATYTDNKQLIRTEFRTLKHHFDTLKQRYFDHNNNFDVVSMGMSDDYPLAIDEGSTMIRVGSKIFGGRT